MWFSSLGGSSRSFWEDLQDPTVLIMILRHYFPFPLSVFLECAVEFSRGYMNCDGILCLLANEICARVLLFHISNFNLSFGK